MKKSLKVILLIIAAIIFTAVLSSCGKEPDLALIRDGTPAVTIVRPSDGDEGETSAAIKLRLYLKDIYGSDDVELVTDRKSERSDRVEILVGATSRDQSERFKGDLRSEEYLIASSDGKLVILGGSPDATVQAVEYFCANYEKVLRSGVFRADDAYRYSVAHTIKTAEIGGRGISDFVIVYPSEAENKSAVKEAAEKLRDGIAELTGYSLRVRDDGEKYEYEILYGRTSRPDSVRLYENGVDFSEISVYCGDGVLAVAPGGIWAEEDILSVISDFADGDRLIIPAGTEKVYGEKLKAKEKSFVYYTKDAEPGLSPVKKFTVCGTDLSKFTVVYHDYGEETGHENELYAAKELVKYLKFATGVELPLSPDTVRYENEILIGATAAGYPFDYDPGEGDALLIATDGGRLYISGSPKRGTLYGVYEFLEKYAGYRFFASDCEVVYKAERIDLPEGIKDLQSSDMTYRDIYAYDTFKGAFAAKRKINGFYMRSFSKEEGGCEEFAGGNGGFVHTMTRLFYIGKDLYRQPCLTDPENLAVAKMNVRGMLERYPESRFVCVSQNDNNYCCRCKNCAAVNRAEGSEAGTLIRFINELADDIRDDFPDVKIITLAYMYSSKPAVTLPRDNVVIELCAYDFCGAHPYGGCPANAEFLDQLKGWHAVTDQLFIWDYVADFNCDYAPFMNFDAIYDNFVSYRENGVIGAFFEADSHRGGLEFGELRSYLISRLMWDPDLTRGEYETMIREFIDGYYGSRTEVVQKYFDFMRSISAGRHFGLYSSVYELFDRNAFGYNQTEIARWFNAASKLKADEPEAAIRHFDKLRESFEKLFKEFKN